MDAVFNSIDEACEFSIIKYNQTPDGQDYFYLLELSALQVLREVPFDTPLKVTKIFSQRQRIAQKTDSILATQTVKNFLDTTVPLVENGCLPCDDLNILIDGQIDLLSHNDGEVHLSSNQIHKLRDLIKRILGRQSFSIDILDEILANSNKYLKLERPNKILLNYDTFDDVTENI